MGFRDPALEGLEEFQGARNERLGWPLLLQIV